MYCSRCGKKLEEGNHFCASCGKMVEEGVGEIFDKDGNTTLILEKKDFQKVEDSSAIFKKESFFTLSKKHFCTNCGTLLEKKTCPNCHQKKSKNNNFCAFCGAEINDSKCTQSNVSVETNPLEKILRFIALFVVWFSYIDAFVFLMNGDITFIAAIIQFLLTLFVNIFILSKRQVYKFKAFLLSKNKKKWWVYVSYVLAIVLLWNTVRLSNSNLSGDDRVAYDLISEVSYEFKNPSSVRLVSGEVLYDEEDCEWCGWFTLSATNGFGATTTGYYFVGYLDGEIFALDLEEHGSSSSIRYAKTQGALDVEKINKALDKKWG